MRFLLSQAFFTPAALSLEQAEFQQGKGVLLIALLLMAAPSPLAAHDPVTTRLTWTREISRIFEKRCVSCHQSAGSAPMALQSFSQAKPWAVAIKEAVLTRQMPPWPAAKGFGEFANDLSLTQEEIRRIAEWVEGGAPEGNQDFLKAPMPVPPRKNLSAPKGKRVSLKGGMPVAGDMMLLALQVRAPGKLWSGAMPIVWGLRAAPEWLIFRDPVRLRRGTQIEGDGAVLAVVRE